VIALERQQGYRGTMTDSPDHRPCRVPSLALGRWRDDDDDGSNGGGGGGGSA